MSGFLNKILGNDTAGVLKKIQYYGNAKTQEGIPELIRYLGHERVEYRRAACRALEHHWMTGNVDAISALTKALADGDGEVRRDAALGLGEFISRSPAEAGECAAAKQALVSLIERESEEGVIKGAVLGLGFAQDGATIAPLADALGSKEKKVIAMAIDALGNQPQTDVRIEMKKALRSRL